MRRSLIALGAVALLASLSGAAGLGVGESAPLLEARETIGLANYSARALEGKLVYLDIFRTW